LKNLALVQTDNPMGCIAEKDKYKEKIVKYFGIYSDQTTIYFSICTIIQWLCIFPVKKGFATIEAINPCASEINVL